MNPYLLLAGSVTLWLVAVCVLLAFLKGSKSTPGTTPPDVDRTQGTFANLKYGGEQ